MARYYTLDRSARLTARTEVHCDIDFSRCKFFPVREHCTQADLEQIVTQLFPKGLSSHGKKYLLDECLVISTVNGPAPYAPHIPIIELIFELTRRLFYPDKPSRYTALFAWASVEEAVAFRNSHGAGTIYEVQADFACKADMNFLYLGGSGIGALFYAMQYWSGMASPSPRWEYILATPAHILDAVSGV